MSQSQELDARENCYSGILFRFFLTVSISLNVAIQLLISFLVAGQMTICQNLTGDKAARIVKGKHYTCH